MKKIHTFDARYRQSVDRVMQSMGLYLISTHRQIENGTLMYWDPQTNCLYALYESGYIRRFTPKRLQWGAAYRRKGTNYAMYQLNPTRIETVTHTYKGQVSKYESIQRIKLNPAEQLGRITIAITNYRNK